MQVNSSETIKLSICIATFNRASFIGATLESMISQMTSICEIVVSDNASTDNTEQIVTEHARTFDRLRYIRQPTNNGLDRNFNSAVENARGEYCWLMTDDDLLKDGAVDHVLNALHRNPSLVIVNVEFRNFDMSMLLQCRWVNLESDRSYGRHEMDRLFTDLDDNLWYIGGVVVKRSIWIERDRQSYFGCLFIHVGMVFQDILPGEALVISKPLISYRMGNSHSYWPKVAEILFDKWPSLVESLAVSDSARSKVRSAQPWKHPKWLLLLRGWGIYSLAEYRTWIRPRLSSTRQIAAPLLIALVPGVVANSVLALYYSIRKDRGRWLHAMKQSRFHIWNRRPFKRILASHDG